MPSRRPYFFTELTKRVTASILLPVLFLTVFPGNIPVMAATVKDALSPSQGQLAVAAIKANKTLPPSTKPSSKFSLSATPTTDELRQARLFQEPLFPLGGKATDVDNMTLGTALTKYAASRDETILENYVTANPQSPWLASVLTNLGLLEFNNGYFSTALADFEQAWNAGQSETDPIGKLVIDRAVSELIKMNCRVGRCTEAKAYMKQVEKRPLNGLSYSMMQDSVIATRLMDHQPKDCFKCGPYALSSILSFEKKMTPKAEIALEEYKTTKQGTSLSEVAALASKLGLQMQPAKRVSGTNLPLPSVVHWKLNHFGALLKKQGDRYLLQDPTFGQKAAVLADAVAKESDGYFLIPAGPLPAGWVSVPEAEAQQVFGRGQTNGQDKGKDKDNDKKTCQIPAVPMAIWSFHIMMTNLHIEDTPVGYNPPLGPAVKLRVTYNHRDTNQPSVVNYPNFGPLWNFTWVSTLTFDTANAYLMLGSGGTENYSNFSSSTNSYAPERDSSAVLVKDSSTQYERDDKDGSKMIFGLSDASGRFYLTQQIDPTGNGLTFTYDSNYRLTGITDALGQVTTLSYASNTVASTNFYLVMKVTDPFGRYAQFAYQNGQLQSITDAGGNVSSFTYGPNADPAHLNTNSFITSLTTPYGKTTFSYTIDANGTRSLLAKEPNGAQQRVDGINDARVNYPNAVGSVDPSNFPSSGYFVNDYLYFRNSFYWDRKAMQQAPGAYNSAHIYHFFHDGNNVSEITAAEKPALKNWIWYAYQNQTDQINVNDGMLENVTQQARVLDSGATQLTNNIYNSLGNLTQTTDPLGRSTLMVYYTNGIDLHYMQQITGPSQTDTLATYTWNTNVNGVSLHEPLTVTDKAGEPMNFQYYSNGQIKSVTNAKNETTTIYYTNGYPTSIQGPDPSKLDRITLSYDSAGRVGTKTNGEGYALVFAYDNLDRQIKLTYPDSTYEQDVYNPAQSPLDITSHTDRQGRTSYYTFDGLRRMTSVTDANNHTIYYGWCSCGALKSIRDANNHTTRWEQDIEGRVVSKTFADNTQEITTYENNSNRVHSIKDALGQTKLYQYNIDDTPASVVYINAKNPTPPVQYQYDPAYKRVTQMSDGIGITNYSYYPITGSVSPGAGQISQVTGPLSNSKVVYSYDSLGRVLTRSINGVAQSNLYDSLGRIYNVTNALGSFTSTFENDSNRISSMSLPNGQQITYSYLGNGASSYTGERRLQQIQNLTSSGGAVSTFGYTFNPEGTISTWTQTIGSSPAQSYKISYDNADQLTNASASGSNSYSYGYDPAGNRQTETVNGNTTSASYNSVNEVTQLTPAKTGDKTYQWDAENRLTGISYTGTSNQTQLKYDGLNRCVQITELTSGLVQSTKRFLWCGTERCEERDAFDNVTKRFFAQGEQIFGKNYYYMKDHLGTIWEMTDGNGNIRANYAFDPWGRRTKLNGDLDADFGFTGFYYHASSALGLAVYRAYDSGTGRWISRDLIGEIGGINLFAYVHNNTSVMTDRLGLCDPNCQGLYNANEEAQSKLKEAIKGVSNAEDALLIAEGLRDAALIALLCAVGLGIIFALSTPFTTIGGVIGVILTGAAIAGLIIALDFSQRAVTAAEKALDDARDAEIKAQAAADAAAAALKKCESAFPSPTVS